MNQSSIYDHIAKIYLDTPLKPKGKEPVREIRKENRNSKKKLILISSVIFALGIFLLIAFESRKPESIFTFENSYILVPDATRIEFSFEPAQQKIFTIGLKELNLSQYKTLEFQLKNDNPDNDISLRVEFVNAFKEKSEIYIKNIGNSWNKYEIDLTEFTKISTWSKMLSLSFIVEEWNVQMDKGVIYIDDIKLLQ